MLDFSPNRNARSEWWYFTGRLVDESDQEHFYALAFFRSAIGIEVSRFAHFLFHSLPSGLGVACERAVSPFGTRVRVQPQRLDYDGWSAVFDGERVTLCANYRSHALQVDLFAGPMFRAAHNGKIDIGPIHTECCSFARLATEGQISIGQEVRAVRGTSWCDHEWGETGFPHRWHWWGINLENGDDLAVRYVREKGIASLRRSDGQAETTTAIHAKVLRRWQSAGGALYPVEWRIELPELALQFEVAPECDGCETPFPLRYWEGPCRVQARSHDGVVRGRGYMELVGYDPRSLRFIAARLVQLCRALMFPNRPATDVGGLFPQR